MDLPIQLTESFWTDVAINVLAGAVAIALGKLVLLAVSIIRAFLQLRRAFSVAGSWIGTCQLPTYGAGVDAIEIYRLVTRRENVEITFFNYRPDSDVVQLCRGRGVWRAHLLSAFYYDPDPQNTESGVFVVRLSGKRLKGTYAQYDVDSDEQLALGTETFELRRVRLSMVQQVRLAVGKRPVKTYAEARALHDSVIQASARAAGANAVAQ